jgi:hypothetical protein
MTHVSKAVILSDDIVKVYFQPVYGGMYVSCFMVLTGSHVWSKYLPEADVEVYVRSLAAMGYKSC